MQVNLESKSEAKIELTFHEILFFNKNFIFIKDSEICD